jgi:hypothetical protein
VYGTEMPLTIRYDVNLDDVNLDAQLYSEIVASRVFNALVFSYVASTLVECHEYYSRLFLIMLGVSSSSRNLIQFLFRQLDILRYSLCCCHVQAVMALRDSIKRHLHLPVGYMMEYKPHDASLRDNSSFRNTWLRG